MSLGEKVEHQECPRGRGTRRRRRRRRFDPRRCAVRALQQIGLFRVPTIIPLDVGFNSIIRITQHAA